MCLPHRVPYAPNKIDYGMINVYVRKKNYVQLYSPEWPHWNRDIKKNWRSCGVLLPNFEKIPFFFFLVFHCWIWRSAASCVYQQRSKYRRVKIMKHTGMSKYVILIKRVKAQHEKKPVTCNLKCMQSVVFEQISKKFIEIFVS